MKTRTILFVVLLSVSAMAQQRMHPLYLSRGMYLLPILQLVSPNDGVNGISTTNCVLITGKQNLLINTPAPGPNNITAVLEMLRELEVDTLHWILNTNGKGNYAGCNYYFEKMHGTSIALPEEDVSLYTTNVFNNIWMWPLSSKTVDKKLRHGESFRINNVFLQIFQIGFSTLGSSAVYEPRTGILILSYEFIGPFKLGDPIIRTKTDGLKAYLRNNKPPRAAYGYAARMLNKIDELLELQPTSVLFPHGYFYKGCGTKALEIVKAWYQSLVKR